MKLKTAPLLIVWRTPVEPDDREHHRDCLHLDHEPDGVCVRRYREDRAADFEYHPCDPRRGYSTVWFPNGSLAKCPHGAQGKGLEALGAALGRVSDAEWAKW